MRVCVVDYDGGNLASAARALAEAASLGGIACEVSITADPATLRRCDRIVLPGQGAFADCARGLAAAPGLRHAIEETVAGGTPFLGICVGMQLMAGRGLEHGDTPGFGWIAGEIAPIEAPGLRLPQMGWNELLFTPGAHPLTDGLEPGDHGYFVHSYALRHHDPADVVAVTEYGGNLPALVARGNRAGTQFHVEKSQQVGLRILANFLGWTPEPGQPEMAPVNPVRPLLSAERATELDDDDMQALCEATNAAILDGGGFGWVTAPGRQVLERYFRGLMMVPERSLFVGRLDGGIVAASQMVRPPRNNEAQAMSATLMHSYVAPYARGHGLARMLTKAVADSARAMGYQVLNLDVRETQTAAISLYESMGFVHWGTHPHYARVAGRTVRGYFYTCKLQDGGKLDD